MKTSSYIAVVALTLVACGKHDSPVSVKSLTFDEGQLKGPTADKGGQPAQLTLSGAINDKLHIEVVGGKGPKGNRVEVEKSRYVYNNDLTEKDKESLKNITSNDFANLGCSEQDEALTSPWIDSKAPISDEQQKINDIGVVMADTVIVCGKDKNRSLGLQILANSVVLVNADITGVDFSQAITITTLNLALYGKNTITSVGKFMSFIPFSGPAINIKVLNQIAGQGSLTIHDEGASVEDPKPVSTARVINVEEVHH